MPTYLGGTFSPLLDISERNLFFQVGGGGGVHVHPVHLHPLRTRLARKDMEEECGWENIKEYKVSECFQYGYAL